jgi:hypothetical protein
MKLNGLKNVKPVNLNGANADFGGLLQVMAVSRGQNLMVRKPHGDWQYCIGANNAKKRISGPVFELKNLILNKY